MPPIAREAYVPHLAPDFAYIHEAPFYELPYFTERLRRGVGRDRRLHRGLASTTSRRASQATRGPCSSSGPSSG